MHISISAASETNAPAIMSLRAAVTESLTRQFGSGHWSTYVSEATVLRGIKTSRVLIAEDETGVIATLRLATKKPWAIDPDYFERVRRPLYLLDMAVEPARQRQGVGRRLEEARKAAQEWPADAIRLDAYESHGTDHFYAQCGFREVGRVVYRGVPLVYFELLL